MSNRLLSVILFGLVIVAAALSAFHAHVTGNAERLQRFVSPGKLSAAHAFLEQECATCHTPMHGVEAAKCIVCHANNEPLLKRQPTAFHANIGSCAGCHLEHRGVSVRPVAMDHIALARIGLDALSASAPETEARLEAERIRHWLRDRPGGLSQLDRALDCRTCHATKDRHAGLFGADCNQCHLTTQWTISGYRHPSASSRDCAQCHQAPPSHYMEHFRMVSQRVTGEGQAQVNECYLCHQTTTWNDIKQVGWYKHH